MKKHTVILSILLAFCLSVGLSCRHLQSPDDRYFDTVQDSENVLTVAICYPSTGTIRSLVALRDEGFLPKEDLIVVGCYHENEVSDYASARTLVHKKGYDWFRFHEIRGSLDSSNLFGENPCSADFRLITDKSDGIIFFGGADIPPEIYGLKTNLLTGISTPARHYMELSFVFHLLGGFQDEAFIPILASKSAYPVLGICLGEQTLNVGTGGTLIQDIWSEVYGLTFVEDVIELGQENWHNNPHRRLKPRDGLIGYNFHRIRLLPDGAFCQWMGFESGDTPFIVSSHHQAVDKTGKGFRPVATSLDGRVVEAIAHTGYPNVLGIQFHPEFSSIYDRDTKVRLLPDDAEGFNIYTFLKSNTPSFKFHKAIWDWYYSKAQAYNGR